MRVFLLAILVLLVSHHSKCQSLEWISQFGGTGNVRGENVTIDNAGNVYTIGLFREITDFDPGPNTFNLTSAGNNDIFIVKQDPFGNLLWVKQLGGAGNEFGYAIHTDNFGNVYATGSFRGNVNFNQGGSSAFLFSNGEDDVFIVKYTTNGAFVWARHVGGTGNDIGRGIATDAFGDVYISGQFRNTVDFDPGVGFFNLISSGSDDGFVMKLTSTGSFQWARRIGGNSTDFCRGIALDGSNNVYVVGSFRNTITVGPGISTVSLTSGGNSDIFAAKFNFNGDLIWAEGIGGTGNNFGQAIAVDDSGNVALTGNFRDMADFNPKSGVFNLTSTGAADAFVTKLNTNGDFLWARQFGGTGNEFGYGIALDAAGNVYTTGAFQNTTNFNLPGGFFNLTSGGFNDAYVTKLDASGAFSWAQRFGGTGDNLGLGIVASPSGNVFSIGRFGNTTNFDPGASNISLTTVGSFDAFVSKINQCPPVFGGDTQIVCGAFTWIDNITYTENNSTATFTISGGSVTGCDSIVTLNLTILENATGTDTVTSCGAYTWIDGLVYTTNNNTATFTISNGAANGCDSVVSLHLTFTNAPSGIDVVSSCESFTWIDNTTYTASNNTATFTIPGGAANGCDSIVTLNLTINNPATGVDVQTACDSFTWIDNTLYSASNNTATFTIPGGAANGCDSIVTLNLTINNPATGIDVQTACDSFTWIDNTTYTASNNTATFTIPGGAANGCDSIVTLNLTINNPATGVDVQTACDSFTWIDNTLYTVSNNTATFTIPGGAANGCDSIVTLNLTINNPATGIDVQTACDAFTWIDNTLYTASNNTATFTIPGGAANGCDSIVSLNLTINSVSDKTISITGTTMIANNANASYQWVDCNNAFSPIPGAINQTFEPTANGNYAVILVENGCTDTSQCETITTISTSESTWKPAISLFPNPTLGEVTLAFTSTVKNIDLTVMNMLGQEIYSKSFSELDQTTFILPEASGVYLITIMIGEHFYSYSVIKQ